jgi:hypothetical protein
VLVACCSVRQRRAHLPQTLNRSQIWLPEFAAPHAVDMASPSLLLLESRPSTLEVVFDSSPNVESLLRPHRDAARVRSAHRSYRPRRQTKVEDNPNPLMYFLNHVLNYFMDLVIYRCNIDAIWRFTCMILEIRCIRVAKIEPAIIF